MQRKLVIIILFLVSSFISVSQTSKSNFSHIEVIIDSADFQNMIKNSFIKDSLGSCAYDTLQKSPLVISYYINGLENFIHFNPNKGHFASQRGTTYLIFQSRRPGQGKELEEQWKSVSADSLKSYNFKGPDFLLTEIVLKEHWDISGSRVNHLIPMLSSYSVATYKKWGLGDSSEVSMKDFLGGDSSKLFNKILSVKLSITKNELNSLTSMLKVTGYKKLGAKFVKEGQPEITFTISERENESKVKEFVLQLNKSIGTKVLDFGTIRIDVAKDKAKFVFN
jgi:hypothetical protein